MERTLTRELRLTEGEVAEAVKYWLVKKHDIQIGDEPDVLFRKVSEDFEYGIGDCVVTSKDEAQLILGEEGGIVG